MAPAAAPGRAGRQGFGVSDLIFVLVTLVAFAGLALLVRGVERL